MNLFRFLKSCQSILIGVFFLMLFTLNSFADTEKVRKYINNIKSRNESVYDKSVEYLFETENDPDIVPEVIKALNDPNAFIRATSIRILATRGIKEAIPIIANIMLHDHDESVRRNAAMALGQNNMQNNNSTNSLITALTDNNNWVRTYAIKALGNLGKKDIIMKSSILLKDKDPYVRISMIGALGNIKDKESTRMLMEALNDKDSGVRKQVVFELEKTGDPTVIPILEKVAKEDLYIEIIDASFRGGKKGDKIKIYPVREEAEKALEKMSKNGNK